MSNDSSLKLSAGYGSVLQSSTAQKILTSSDKERSSSDELTGASAWLSRIDANIDDVFTESVVKELIAAELYVIGQASLYAFLQSNVTGPPLDFSSSNILCGQDKITSADRDTLLASLSIDGESAYNITPNVELFCLAKAIFASEHAPGSLEWRWMKLRTLFLHQRLLSDVSASLQAQIFRELDAIRDILYGSGSTSSSDDKAKFLLEQAVIENHHGLDVQARASIDKATVERRFQYVLTGKLGKRTKFQQKDISQLVVLAKSAVSDSAGMAGDEQLGQGNQTSDGQEVDKKAHPDKLDLNDDTLLESISFTKHPSGEQTDAEDDIPLALKALDPSNQPQLEPLDAIILLAMASSITNNSPNDGLTRENTVPYATRVLDDGSTNWQVFSQALLVRSRTESYKARTVERGVLQLQALVDQVIAEVTEEQVKPSASTFIPRAKASESASVTERLQYIFQLASPTQWDLEAELAERWLSLGGMRTALEIYERLEMWPEAALCWAATDREDIAERIIRHLLYHEAPQDPAPDEEAEEVDDDDYESGTWEGPERDPLPQSAPRLFCILGDITKEIQCYQRAWDVSGGRYARAQRSLGRHYFAKGELGKAVEAYEMSLKTKPLDRGTWFAVGCAHLQLSAWEAAATAFTRCIQIDESDAQAWTNLANALLKKGTSTSAAPQPGNQKENDGDDPQIPMKRPDQHKYDALNALKRAAALEHDDYRIWSNLMVIATSVNPPDFTSLIQGQLAVIRLRGPVEGERCIDVDIVERLVQHIIANDPGTEDADSPRPRKGLERVVVQLVEQKIVPLITSNARLWKVVSRMYVWLRRPALALDAEEKSWRAVTGSTGWETGSEAQWTAVVDATIELVDAYESFGSDDDGWRFKARSAIRGVKGRARESWEGTKGWRRLKERLADLQS